MTAKNTKQSGPASSSIAVPPAEITAYHLAAPRLPATAALVLADYRTRPVEWMIANK